MAVAAYASVLSLLRVIDNAQHPSRLRLFPDATLIDSLRGKICFLQEFFELHSSKITEDVEFIAREIPRVALKADILIDNYVVDRLYNESQDLQNDVVFIMSFNDEMHRVMQQIESIIQALTTALRTSQQKPPTKSKEGKFTCDEPQKDKVVGFDDQLKQVLEKLTGNKKDLVIVPIVGMGGIGKTTLARSVFDHPYNLHHFHVRIWLTISQDYSIQRVLQELLKILGESGDRSESVLITKLHQKLFGQRYLVVLDDVWSLEAWDVLRRGLPDNGKASRVVVTTRLYDIASSLGCDSYSMKFLDEDASWYLFSQRAFERGARSHELEEIGRKISKRCKGLPLLLVVVGGLLASSNMRVDHWRAVAEDISSFANSGADEHCSRVLSSSYDHLPIHLKPCFLYMGRFREDEKVLVSKLILNWVAEGFVKPARGKSLEESAREYLEDLVGRNMLLVRKRGTMRNIKTCGIHDLLRDFCIAQRERERLLEVPRYFRVKFFDFDNVCFICQEKGTDMAMQRSKVLSPDYSKHDGQMLLVCGSCQGTFPELVASPRLVAALTVRYGAQDGPPLMTKYRFLSTCPSSDLLRAVHLLWNLETVNNGICTFSSSSPWKMPQIRHISIYRDFTLHDPAANDAAVLENLQTFRMVDQFKCTEDIARRIPNLRKLGLSYNGKCFGEEGWSSFHLRNLPLLEKLESLQIQCYAVSMDLDAISFPRSLRKLTLYGCQIAWDDLTVVGSLLPNLQVLKLLKFSVRGEEWNPVEGEFLRLKYLKLFALDLVHWRLSEAHFPALETVFLRCMDDLEAIPREIGELPSLRSIYLRECKKRIIDSAKVIVNEQLCCGNERLVLRVLNYWGDQIYQSVGTT